MAYLWHFKYVTICGRTYEKKLKSEFHVFGLFPGLQNLIFFEKFTAEIVFKSFSCRNNPLEVPVFGFANSLPNGWKNQESHEP